MREFRDDAGFRHRLTLLIPALPIFLADVLDQRVVYPRAVREHERAARTEFVEKEQLLVATDLAMVALGGLSEILLVFGELLCIRERDAVDALQRVVRRITEEVGGRVLVKASAAEVD